MKATTLLTAAVFLSLAAPTRAQTPAAVDGDFFEKKVRPVLVAHCFRCHGNGKSKGGLSLASRQGMLKGGASGPAIVVNDTDKSLLLQAIRHDGETRMPPKKKLPDAVIADLTAWVKRGAPWPETASSGDAIRSGSAISAADRAFWAFRAIADPPPPSVKDKAWVRKPLDRFVLAKLEEKGLHPVRPADKHALLRRVSFESIKSLHREILLSATYRMSCAGDEHNAAVDPGNRMLWRMNRQRLDVEAWRDALLAASGELDDRLGGAPADIGSIGNKRRTLYGKISRHNLNSLLRLFDFPDPNISSGARPVTIVPLQQLFVLNSEFMIARAGAWQRN